MKILIVGSGGRGHALAWAVRGASRRDTRIASAWSSGTTSGDR